MNLTLELEGGHNDERQRHLIDLLLVLNYYGRRITR